MKGVNAWTAMARPAREESVAVTGDVEEELTFSRDTLGRMRESQAPEDIVAEYYPGPARAVWVEALLQVARPSADADHVTFHAADGYAASLPLDQAAGSFIVFEAGGEALAAEEGGPMRAFLPEGPSYCTNVKSVQRLELTRGPGKDTVPRGPHQGQG